MCMYVCAIYLLLPPPSNVRCRKIMYEYMRINCDASSGVAGDLGCEARGGWGGLDIYLDGKSKSMMLSRRL